jgi:hypothetical protein
VSGTVSPRKIRNGRESRPACAMSFSISTSIRQTADSRRLSRGLGGGVEDWGGGGEGKGDGKERFERPDGQATVREDHKKL